MADKRDEKRPTKASEDANAYEREARSSVYYQPVPASQENLELMELIDRQYLERPF